MAWIGLKKYFALESLLLFVKSARCHSDMGISVFGVPIPKTLVIWTSPVTLTLTQIAKLI